MPRTFNGTSAVQVQTIGGCNISSSALTGAMILKRNSNTGIQAFLSLCTSAGSGGRVVQWKIYGSGDAAPNGLGMFSGAGEQNALTVATTDNWVLVGADKASGTATPRFHKYVFDTATWSHSNGGGTLANNTAPGTSGQVRIGESDGDYFNGDALLAAVWNRQLTDGEWENLAHTLQAWYASAPSGLWVLDQSLTTQNVSDLTGGGANQSSTSNTTVSTSSLPVWNYGAGPWVIVRPQGAGSPPPSTPAFRMSLLGVGR